MAADELWEKLRKDKESLEMIAEEIEKPFEEAEKLVWERYPNRILEFEQQGFDILINYCFSASEGEIKRGLYNDLQPYFLDIAYYLCIFHDQLAYSGRWEKRLEVSRKIYSLDPVTPDFKDLYAEALLYWGDISEGERLYNELTSKMCENPIFNDAHDETR